MNLRNNDKLSKELTTNSEMSSQHRNLETERNNLLQSLNENITRSVPHESVVEIEQHLDSIMTSATNDGTVSPDDVNDVKSYILTQITEARNIIEDQEDTIATINKDTNCFTNNCIMVWLLIFVVGSVALLFVRNCAKYVVKVNQYTQDTVLVIDGDYSSQTDSSFMTNVCTITTENRQGERTLIPIQYPDQGSCKTHIQSILGKHIRVYYDNSNTSSADDAARIIIYPITDVTKTLLKKFAMMCVAIFVFYFIYKKNLSHNVNVITT